LLETIVADGPTRDEKIKCMNTVFWLWSVCTRLGVAKDRAVAKTEAAVAKRARADAQKKKAQAEAASSVLKINEEKKKAAKMARLALANASLRKENQ
jgi:hypothetical protein